MSMLRYFPVSDHEASFGNSFPSGLRAFQDSVNRLFTEPNARPGSPMWIPAVDIQETDHELIVKADLPAIDRKDIDIQMENGTLTLRGHRKFEANTEGEGPSGKAASEKKMSGGWHRLERSYGSFERAFTLPDSVNAEAVKADYTDGVLTITLPKKELAKPRQIKVEIGADKSTGEKTN